jgi:hypothetical protein
VENDDVVVVVVVAVKLFTVKTTIDKTVKSTKDRNNFHSLVRLVLVENTIFAV